MAKTRVLLVDDEKDFLDVGIERINSWGYKVSAVCSGPEAIDIVKNKGADIIVLDYIMPDMDGVFALKQIREIDPKIPVIMFTAFPDERSIEGTEKLGVSVFIPKLSAYSDPWSALRTALDIVEKNLKV